ncbi:hypothetical protein BT96DRAFT_993632 [Gymnopus androsaceus JB14]|uniref:Uncharacterized protein n=1 Tax=Gymnopus androsaceus JB14 TaxID=1447944 RepID=A0A6A4HP85_9AGAR|nr:hypothetical protein BT96DRAFT_993632 [Gymnopus androsaceus JB14]
MDLIRDASFDTLCCELSVMQHGNGGKAPLMYILTLAESKQIIALKLCILVYYPTRGKDIPKELQLRAAIASIERNLLVVATTGFGRTHIMALLILLEKSTSNKIFITIQIGTLKSFPIESWVSEGVNPKIAFNLVEKWMCCGRIVLGYAKMVKITPLYTPFCMRFWHLLRCALGLK